MTVPVHPPLSPPSAASGSKAAADPGSATTPSAADKSPTTRFVVERRTRGLVWTERVGCALASAVAVVPPALFCHAMLGLLQGENGVTLLLLSIAMALGACVSIFVGLAVSVFVWWIPRMVYLALHPKVRRNGVRAGVRSRGIWISGIGWIGWNGLHLREKAEKPGSQAGAAMVIQCPDHGELVLHSPENVPDLLKQVRRYLDAQNTEFQNTEMLPVQTTRSAQASPSKKAA
ncbi:MAG: hypothetical protein V4739_17635 [Pseudomonadota bacterium]